MLSRWKADGRQLFLLSDKCSVATNLRLQRLRGWKTVRLRNRDREEWRAIQLLGEPLFLARCLTLAKTRTRGAWCLNLASTLSHEGAWHWLALSSHSFRRIFWEVSKGTTYWTLFWVSGDIETSACTLYTVSRASAVVDRLTLTVSVICCRIFS